MLRWLGIIVALCVMSASADAQVFKPKSKKAAATKKESSADPDKKAAKKQPRTSATKKRPKKKTKAASADEEEDVASEPEPKGAAKDYVKIWDDDAIE
jgi:hypothetical protein